ncbi:hypothetical protein P7D22_03290 [Lichenihabitans sp. Uapishka_5]|uniref:hypothetical protein n=1 Tax=Lichenihabitans sp. Uapishka_5 TaxID=3037302 RepID=UPI0029E7D0A7|nr:hypothetical protein [Lichenihabitans sp. Uapishka_5]MDX7950202.1 hypothetical protein [Lichenihabitans sp. Uapishka_5]
MFKQLAIISVAAAALGVGTCGCFAQTDGPPAGPGIFNRTVPSSIGSARQTYDRQTYDSYRGDPGAQFELRQKRQNLCRNVPEMC